jgi:ElaB/YqjD/DUF883 family membrane-anchored ribosome-binding protein
MKKTKGIPHPPSELLSDLQAHVAAAESMISGSLSEHSAEAFRILRARFDAARERFAEVYDETKQHVAAGAACADATIRAKPYQSLAIALGVGLLAGLLIRPRGR